MASRDVYSRIALIVFCCPSSIQAHDQDCDEFTVQPQDVVALAGQMAMMKCEYTGLAVEWDKEGYSIIPMHDEPCDCHVTDDGTLHFNNVSRQDEGEYTCVAQMGFSAARCSASLWIADECETCWSSSRDSSLPTPPVTTHTLAVQTTSTDTVPTSVPSSSPLRTTEMTNPSSPVVSDVLLSAIVALLILSTLVIVLVVLVVVVCVVWRNRRGYRISDNEGEMDVDLNPAYQTTASFIPSASLSNYCLPYPIHH